MPFYLMLGVGADHRAAAEKMIVTLRDELATKPTVADHVRLGIIEFDDEARIRLPLGDLLDPTLKLPPPPGPAGDGAAYGAALAALYSAIAEDVPALMETDGIEVRRPLAWMVTDRPPTDAASDREAAFRALADSPGYPYLVPTGFADAPDAALRPLIYPTHDDAAMAAFHADDSEGIAALGALLARTMLAVPHRADIGVVDVVALPGELDLPPGLRRLTAAKAD